MAMAGKNEVTLTFSGDSDQLARAFADTSQAADRMRTEVSGASDRMARETGAATDRMAREVRASGEAFDRAAEATDALDTRAMGFRDTVTGVQDSVLGFSQVLKGDLSADALVTAGMGVGDLASGFTNLLIPAVKDAGTWVRNAGGNMLEFARNTTRGQRAVVGATAAMGAMGAALAVFSLASDEADVNIGDLEKDLRRMAEQGRISGELLRVAGDDTDAFKRQITDAVKEFERIDDSFRAPEWLASPFGLGSLDEQREALENIEALDEAMNQMIRSGSDGDTVFQSLADTYGLNQEQLDQLLGIMPETTRALEQQESAAQDAVTSLEELADTLRAQTDPVFAFVKAQQQVEEAQRAVTDAVDEFGRNSPEHRQALLDLADAELGLVDATSKVDGAFDKSLLPTLEQLVEDGHLSERAFRELTEELDRSKQAADRLDGTRSRLYVDYRVTASGGQPGTFHTTPGGGRIPFHIGGVVPGPVGTEVPAILQAGEQVIPRGGGRGQSVTIVIQAGSHRQAEAMRDDIRDWMRTNHSFRQDMKLAVA
jgi:methyl-accepting chemotaxis protein